MKFKEKFNNQKAVVGSWVQIASPTICEIFARGGLDWFAIDMEHTEISYETVADMFRGVKNTDTSPFVRVRSNNALDIRRALDIGAKGIIVPLVDDAIESNKAVSYCKYPKKGVRGHAFCRANNWGVDFDEYAKNANEEIAIFVMIESKKAVENIDEILQVEGLDGVFIGPYDMSASYGVTGEVDNKMVKNACDKVLNACKKYGKIAGIHLVKAEKKSITKHIDQGYQFIAVGIDALFVIDGVNKIKEAISCIKST
jgi:2-keto-3-deoxy-L-rhamnonate aldolase RhmA